MTPSVQSQASGPVFDSSFPGAPRGTFGAGNVSVYVLVDPRAAIRKGLASLRSELEQQPKADA